MNAVKTLIYKDGSGQIFIDEFDQFCVTIVDRDDPSHSYTYMPHNPEGLVCPICGINWEPSPRGVMDQFYCRDAEALVHKTCYERWLGFQQRMLFISALNNSNFRVESFDQIPNQYKGAWNTPWYVVTFQTPGLRMTIGRRKRVFSVTFESDDDLPFSQIKKMFKEEDVTKEFNSQHVLLHAWSDEKLREYIKKLSEVLVPDEKEPGYVCVKTQQFSL